MARRPWLNADGSPRYIDGVLARPGPNLKVNVNADVAALKKAARYVGGKIADGGYKVAGALGRKLGSTTKTYPGPGAKNRY